MFSIELFVEQFLENIPKYILGEVNCLGLEPLCAWIDLDY
tara:strand:+ start:964 stop:1083 length:120 start_codon:yes stop_codon:yes gene_type:complete